MISTTQIIQHMCHQHKSHTNFTIDLAGGDHISVGFRWGRNKAPLSGGVELGGGGGGGGGRVGDLGNKRLGSFLHFGPYRIMGLPFKKLLVHLDLLHSPNIKHNSY
jgi:hypothetical protein